MAMAQLYQRKSKNGDDRFHGCLVWKKNERNAI